MAWITPSLKRWDPGAGLWNITLLWFRCLLPFQNHINIRKKVQLKTKTRASGIFVPKSPNRLSGFPRLRVCPPLPLSEALTDTVLSVPPTATQMCPRDFCFQDHCSQGPWFRESHRLFLSRGRPFSSTAGRPQDMTAQKTPRAEASSKPSPLIFPDLLWVGCFAFSRKTLGKNTIPWAGWLNSLLCSWSDRQWNHLSD